MVIPSLSHTYRRLHHWWRRSTRRTVRPERRYRPPALETLETRTVPDGTWTALVNPPPDQIGTMFLLSDGTVMAQGASTDNGFAYGASQKWYKLTPDAQGNYADGTWSAVAEMHLARFAYASNVLPDGRIFVLGGEYSGNETRRTFTNKGEIYDPVANTWTNIADFPKSMFGDDPTELAADPSPAHPDGLVLAGYITGDGTFLYDPYHNTWTRAARKLDRDRSDEETWVKLPDGSILSYSIWNAASGAKRLPGKAERYVPSTNTWAPTKGVPVKLSSAFSGRELGGALLLPDGRVFQIGGGNLQAGAPVANTAFYTLGANGGSWTAGPEIPNGYGADDAPAAMMPNGDVLLAADHLVSGGGRPRRNVPTGPTAIFEFDPVAGTYTNVTPPNTTIDLTHIAQSTRMLDLPTGEVLMSNSFRQLAIYTPMGTPSNAWRPTITTITSDNHGTYTLTGTQLNGISEGTSFGDDVENSTNYPIVQLTASNGLVYFARTFNWSSTGVQTGSTPVTTKFTLPANLPEGTYSLEVIASGIASNPVPFTYSRATHYTVTPSVSSVVAGSNTLSVTVRVLDALNQAVPSYPGTVHFSSDDIQADLPVDYTFTAADHGVHTFTNIILRTAGLHRVVATDVTISSITGSGLVQVTPAGVAHLGVSTTATNPQLAGVPFDVTVTAQDAYNNTVTGYTGVVGFATTDPDQARIVLPYRYTFSANEHGVHTFHGVTLQTPCAQTVMAIGVFDGINGSALVNVVTSPNVTHFLVTAPSGPPMAGVPFNVTVTAQNMCNGTVANYSGMVTFSSSDPGAILPPSYRFTLADRGVHTFSVTLKKAGFQAVTVTNTATGITGTTGLSEFPATATESGPYAIVTGPDHNLWFTEASGNVIGQLTPGGVLTEFPVPTPNAYPAGIAVGGDGNLWFAEPGVNKIGRITPAGVFLPELTVPTPNSLPSGLTSAPDHSIWFTERGAGKIGHVTTTGAFTEYALPSGGAAYRLAVDSLGNVWAAEFDANKIGLLRAGAMAVTEFTVPLAGSGPFGITVGPDGNAWFTERTGNQVGRITTAGVVTEYPIPTVNSLPSEITVGPDGNLWFTELVGNRVGRITLTPSITIQEFAVPTANSQPFGITAGPDGNLWFTDNLGDRVGRITTAGTVTEFSVATTRNVPYAITAGPDGNLWFTEVYANRIVRLTPAGVRTEFPLPTANAYPAGIAVGGDGNLWFAESGVNKIGRVTTTGVFLSELTLPTPNSFPFGLASAPDGSLWFTEVGGDGKLANVTTAGVFTEYALSSGSSAFHLAVGRDGSVWVAEYGTGLIGLLSAGATTVKEYSVPEGAGDPFDIAVGPDRNAWFTELNGPGVGRVTPADGTFTQFNAGAGNPNGIVVAPDGNVWFTRTAGNTIDRLTPDGVLTPLPMTAPASGPGTMTLGPDGNPWFLESSRAGHIVPAVSVMPARAAQFVVTTTPSGSQVAGVPFSVTVTVLDAFGNLVPNYAGTVHFTSSDPRASLPGNYTFLASDHGVHTFVNGVTLGSAGDQTVTITDTANTSVTGSVTVTVATLHFAVAVTAADPQTAGVPFDVTVTAEDPQGNILTNYTGTVRFSSGDPYGATLPADYTFTTADHGVHTFPVGATLYTAGTWDVTVTDMVAGITGTVMVNVTAAAADHFLVSTTAANPQTAGVPFTVAVTAFDMFDNVATNYTGTITFFTGDVRAVLPPDYTFTTADRGIHVFANGATLYTAGSWDLTAQDVATGIQGVSTVNVTAAPAVAFQVTAPANATAGVPFDVTVTALDPYGNIDTNYQGTVTFSSSDMDPGVVLPADYTFTTADAGVHVFTDTGVGETTLITPGDQTIMVMDTADNTITGTTTVTVVAGPVVSGRRGLIPLAVALTPAAPRQTVLPATSAANLERAGVDRFFSSAANDPTWTVPGLKPPLGRQVLPKMPDGDMIEAGLNLDQPLV